MQTETRARCPVLKLRSVEEHQETLGMSGLERAVPRDAHGWFRQSLRAT